MYKKMCLASLHGLLDEIMRYPLVVGGFFYLCFNCSFVSLLLFVVISIIQLLTSSLISRLYDARAALQLREITEKYKTCTFTKVPVEELLSEMNIKKKVDVLLYYKKGIPYYGDVFQVINNDPKNPVKQLISFPFCRERSVIITTDDPYNNSVIARFRLLHEIGHWLYVDYRCWIISKIAVFSFIAINLFAFLFVIQLWLLILIFLISLFWFFQNLQCERFYTVNKVAESISDAFAYHLTEEKQIIHEYYRKYKFNEEQQRLDYFRKWFENPIDIENNHFFRKIIPSFMQSHILNNGAINFHSSVERLFIPPLLSNIWFFVVLVIQGWFAQPSPSVYLWWILAGSIPIILIYRYIVSHYIILNNKKSKNVLSTENRTNDEAYNVIY